MKDHVLLYRNNYRKTVLVLLAEIGGRGLIV